MLRIFYQSDMENKLHQLLRRSADCCYLRSLPGYPVCGILPSWKLPIPVLPESHRHLTACIHDNRHCPSCLRSPYPPLQRFPVPENRWTYLHPGYVSYPDVPAGKIQDDVRFPDLLPGNIPSVQVRCKDLALYVLWTVQSGHDLLFPDLSDPRSSLQNTSM